ncbi:MAG: hypothetical protein RMI88_04330 [Nitrososphaerota archaeon]|nr:hypothetical protein [Nitrososphaerota archaeon]
MRNLLPLITIMFLIAVSTLVIVNSEEQKVRIIFYIDTGLGDRIKISECEVEVLVGENVSCRVPYTSLEYRGNNTRIIFKGWYEDRVFITSNPILNVTAKDSPLIQEYTAMYQVQYLVELDTGYQVIREWRNRGSFIVYDILESWNAGEGVRKIFSKWVGDIQSDQADIYIQTLTKPLKAKAIWKTQYYVKIISDYPLSLESNWFNEEEVITIEPVDPVIYLDGGETKIELQRFVVNYLIEDYKHLEIDEKTIRIVVNSSMVIKAIWKKLHHIVLESDYIKPILFDGWVEEGSRLIFKEMENEVTWKNGTKIIFDRWVGGISISTPIIDIIVEKPLKARATWRVYYLVSVESEAPVKIENVGWVERGSHLIIDANPIEREVDKGVRMFFKEWTGSIVSSNPIIDIRNLDGPIIIKAVWIRKYLVEINAPEASKLERELWITENEGYDIIATKNIELDEFTRLVFDRWIGCSEAIDNLCTINMVKSHLSIRAEYYIEKNIKLLAISLNNKSIEEVEFKLRHEKGDVKQVYSNSQLWMRIGNWKIESAIWRGFDVISTEQLRIDVDSNNIVRIMVRIFEFSFKISDYFGFPVRDAKIIIKTEDGRVMYEGKTDENGLLKNVGPLPPVNLFAYVYYQDYELVREFDLKTSSPLYLTIPLSQTSLQIIILVSLVTGSLLVTAIIKVRKKRREMPIEIPLPPEPTPPVIRVDEYLEEVEIKKAPTVTLDDVIKKLEMSGEKIEDVFGDLAKELKKKKKKSTRGS